MLACGSAGSVECLLQMFKLQSACMQVFDGWQATATRRQRHRSAVQVAVTRLTHRTLASAFAAWAAWAPVHSRQRQTAARCLQRLQSRTLASGFAAWREHAARKQDLKVRSAHACTLQAEGTGVQAQTHLTIYTAVMHCNAAGVEGVGSVYCERSPLCLELFSMI